MTNKDYRFLIFAELRKSDLDILGEDIVVEIIIRNTVSVITLKRVFVPMASCFENLVKCIF